MAGDNLKEIIEAARREMPDVPDHVWAAFERITRQSFGAQRVYIASHKKRRRLEALQEAQRTQDEITAQEVAKVLGVTVRHARRYRDLVE